MMKKKQIEYVGYSLGIGYQQIVSYIGGLFRGPYLQCLLLSKVEELLTELYEGVCGNHIGGCLLAH